MSSVPAQTVFVGLDYHTESVQVCVLAPDGKVLINRSCGNDWRAVAGVVRNGWALRSASRRRSSRAVEQRTWPTN